MGIRPVEKVDDNVKVERALISVFDKKGLNDFAEGLVNVNHRLMIYSTGGTFTQLKEFLGSTNLTPVSEYTGMPETEGGLVKTLHHKLYLGLLTETHNESHQQDLQRENALLIDLVVCNLYPFSSVTGRENVTFEEARMNIDIGGPTMIRAAAKNFHRVGVVVSPEDYVGVLQELHKNNGSLTLDTRFRLMGIAFNHTAEYDIGIDNFMARLKPDFMRRSYQIGEN